jgi:ribose-phosphate pyrophosphokinase
VDPVIVAPDAGGVERARAIAKRLNAGLAIIDKRRDGPNVAVFMHLIGEVKGRDAVVIDDMIDTAGTVTETARALKKLGARDIYICATHGLLSGPAVQRLKDAPIAEVVITDSVVVTEEKMFDRLRVLSVGELLAKAIRFTHSEQSVSSLFD